jgi:hypothetical protein
MKDESAGGLVLRFILHPSSSILHPSSLIKTRQAHATKTAHVNQSVKTAAGEYPSSSVLRTSMVVVAVTIG